ncbi:MAG: homoserine dehydrogenase [Ruminococcaceae bacterium]|nr:homoserine dehydrogenase [Oscillospiraceae bacterium]
MINLAIFGFGTVGSGVYDVIRLNLEDIEKKLGDKVRVKYILDIRDFSSHPLKELFVKDIDVILNDGEVSTVVEAMGGSHPAVDFSLAALKKGKNVITSNKEVVANFGCELLKTAKENNVRYLFEASVGGGIPIIRPLITCLAGNGIQSITGILNGTTNFILNEMFKNGKSFEVALKEAQELGYAEKNPAADVEGLDPARKICILSDIAFGHKVSPDSVPTEGITNITLRDVKDAEKSGYTIKLLGNVEKCEKGIYIMVCPFFVKNDAMLANVSGVFNGVRVIGNAVGELLFYGAGAGKMPTASAIVADIMDVESKNKLFDAAWEDDADPDYVLDISKRETAMYLRFEKSPDASTVKKLGLTLIEGTDSSYISARLPEGEILSAIREHAVASSFRIL